MDQKDLTVRLLDVMLPEPQLTSMLMPSKVSHLFAHPISSHVIRFADEWDDHEGLSPSQMSSVQEWEMQFSERYEYVGKLIPDGQPLENEEEEDESDKAANAENQD